MKTREQYLRDAAAYVREHGYSPEYYEDDDRRCGCFAHAWHEVAQVTFCNVRSVLLEVIGTDDIDTSTLIHAGWTRDHPEDAAAALEIAADLSAP